MRTLYLAAACLCAVPASAQTPAPRPRAVLLRAATWEARDWYDSTGVVADVPRGAMRITRSQTATDTIWVDAGVWLGHPVNVRLETEFEIRSL